MGTIAQTLRRRPSLSELRMWHVLRPFRERGFHFRKQAQIGVYVVDFVCHHAMVVVEVDGEQHGTTLAQQNDETRDEYLRSRGFRVLRIPSIELTDNKPGVYEVIDAALSDRPSLARGTPSPAALGPDGPSSATLPARGRVEESNG